jgi:hypothetical protein
LDRTAARGCGGTGSGAGASSDGTWPRAAADSSDFAENGRPGSVSCAGCTGRTQALRGMHLEARFGGTGPERDARHRRVARSFNQELHMQEGGEKGKTGAGDAPYHTVELRGHLPNGGKWRSGSASGGRGAAVMAGLRG